MKNRFKKSIYLLGLVLIFGTTACEDFWESMLGEGPYEGSWFPQKENTEDVLFVVGSGQNIVLEYNSLTFKAALNWQDGNYYFAPDKDGNISGNKIVCAAAISQWEVEGDCFRDQHVCHFEFTGTHTDDEDKDAYWLNDTTCRTAAGTGPFLVPLEAPLCGEDPFPACPGDDLFPSGPGVDEDMNESTEDEEDPAKVVDLLINELCAAAARCDDGIHEEICIEELYGPVGSQIWDDFGLTESENTLTADDVVNGLNDGSITSYFLSADRCLTELWQTCNAIDEAVDIGTLDNVENLISEEGACPLVLSE